jgi:hypothetical protein
VIVAADERHHPAIENDSRNQERHRRQKKRRKFAKTNRVFDAGRRISASMADDAGEAQPPGNEKES